MSLSLRPRFGTFFDDFDAFGSVGPAVHVRESHDHLVLELEVPRYRFEDVKVEIEGQHLVISGNRPVSVDHHQYNQFLIGEAPMNSFRRTVYIPSSWDLTHVVYELNYGVLQVRIPLAPTPVPPPHPQHLYIAGPHHTDHHTVVPYTDKNGLQVSTTASPSEFNAIAQMKWPPKIKVDDKNGEVTYTASMPPTVDKDHIDLSLDGRELNLGVHHQRNIIKKDTHGNVVFNQDQSVSYSTNLLVPEGTKATDISTNYTDGQLNIHVSKHPNPHQEVMVKKLA